ncbi:hypothetical protein BB559_004985 [Furculomyces boomerangus]|uniref:J domain-containing protein n=1 Tax=Furculomyces boomerangus TaxID=61424 RepID=A0A2T9YBJ9_9FUNG|nr:hypothetical protein BB559_004985 [Furculomyces boomerangus]
MKFSRSGIVLFVVCMAMIKVFGEHKWRKTLDMEIIDTMKDIKSGEGSYDWYKIIGVTEDANVEEITKAHRIYSRRHHPDKLKGTPEEIEIVSERFKNIGVAVGILKEEFKRKRYDYFRKHGIPIWSKKTKIYKFGFYVSFYIWWYQVLAAPFVIAIVLSTIEYITKAVYYQMAQKEIESKKSAGTYFLQEKKQVSGTEKDILIKETGSEKEINLQLENIKNLDSFKAVFGIKDAESIEPATFSGLYIVRKSKELVEYFKK